MTLEQLFQLIVDGGTAAAIIVVVVIFMRANERAEKERLAHRAAEEEARRVERTEEREYRRQLFEQCHAKHTELAQTTVHAINAATAAIADAAAHTRRCAEAHEQLEPVLRDLTRIRAANTGG